MQFHFNLFIQKKIYLFVCLFIAALTISACVPIGAESSTATPFVVELDAEPDAEQYVAQADESAVDGFLEAPQRCGVPSSDVAEIVIGALLPLSESPAIQAGAAMQAAIDIAVKDVNEEGGLFARPIRVITYDTKGSPAIGIKAAEKLIVEDCVVALIGVYHSRVGMAVKEIAHQYGVPIIFSEPYNDAITSDFYPEVFRVAPTTRLTAQTYVDWIYSVGDHNGDETQTVVIVADSSTFESSNGSLIAEQLVADEQAAVETLLIDLPADDFSSMIARIIALENSPDTILIWFNGDPGYAFHTQLIEAGIGPQNKTLVVLRHSTINSELFWQRVPQGLHTVITKVGPWYSTVTEMGESFANAYRDHADRWPESYAFQAYDSTRLIAGAIQQAESLESQAIIDALESIDVELASGRYYFPYGSKNAPNQVDVPAYMWHQWPDPHILFLRFDDIDQDAAEMSVLWPEVYRTIDFSAVYFSSE